MLALLSSALALRVPAPRMVSSWYASGVRLSGAAGAADDAGARSAASGARQDRREGCGQERGHCP